jgi:GTP-binding protein LepA
LSLIATAAGGSFLVTSTNGQKLTVINPSDFPTPTEIEKIEEPWVSISVITPSDYIGPLMELLTEYEGSYKQTEYLGQTKSLGKLGQRVRLVYEMPLRSILTTFYDQLKSRSRGFASLDYELAGYRETRLVKLDVLVNGVIVDAFSRIVPPKKVYEVGKTIVAKLKEVIPRQLFKVPIQATVGSRIVAREDISAKRKDVLVL